MDCHVAQLSKGDPDFRFSLSHHSKIEFSMDSQTTYNFAFKSQLGIVSNLNEFSKPKKFRKRIALNYVFKR